MKQYFIHDGQSQQGPFDLEQLKSTKISKDYMVWCEGMDTWKPAGEIEELKSLFVVMPPPLPSNISVPPPLTPKTPPSAPVVKKNKKALVWIIVGAVLGTLLIAALIFFLVFKSCRSDIDGSLSKDSVATHTDSSAEAGEPGAVSGKPGEKNTTASNKAKEANNLTAEQQREEEQKAAYRTNWRKHVFARPNWSNGPFNVVVNPSVTLTNSLPYTVNEVTVYVNYILVDGSTWKSEKIAFYNIGPNSSSTKNVPPTDRGTSIQTRISKVTSSSLGLYYSN
ncbi:MAG TPA: DUF4339 domain-containing protein [Bacteroidales bacterium]|nr:DUF4339 domain-containing protein [Bacteroidales bacterium]